MKQVEAGDFEIQVESKAHDEIGMLIQSFNYMISRLRQLIMEAIPTKTGTRRMQNLQHFRLRSIHISFTIR